MTDLKINEENLQELAKDMTELCAAFMMQVEILKDKKADIFRRYMAMNKLACVYSTVEHSINLFQNLVVSGHAIHHEVFHTDDWKENEWDRVKLHQSDFFKDEEETDSKKRLAIDASKLPDEVQKELFDILKKALQFK